MTDTEYKPPAPLLEALCIYEAFRRLGFGPDDLHAVFGEAPDGKLHIGMRARNPFTGKTFVLGAKEPLATVTADNHVQEWERAAMWWNTTGASTDAYENSNVRKHGGQLVAALMFAGLYPIKIGGAPLAN